MEHAFTRKKHCHTILLLLIMIIITISAPSLCVSFIAKPLRWIKELDLLSGSWFAVRCSRPPNDQCCTSPWALHGLYRLTIGSCRVTWENWQLVKKNSIFTNIKRGATGGVPQGHSHMDSALTQQINTGSHVDNQNWLPCFVFYSVTFALSDHLLLPKRHMLFTLPPEP